MDFIFMRPNEHHFVSGIMAAVYAKQLRPFMELDDPLPYT
jgi:hypothetical protein